MAIHDFPRGSTERFVGNIYLDLNIVKGLVFHSDFNFDLSFVHSRSFTEAYYHSQADQRDENMISQSLSRSKGLNFNNYLTDYWGGMVEKGADTFWEAYDPRNDYISPYNFHPLNSYCHAWSCTPVYFIHTWPEVFLK